MTTTIKITVAVIAFLVVGFTVPYVMANVGGGHSQSPVKGTPVVISR